MTVPFTITEVLEIAEQMEIRGGKFYREAAKHHVSARDLLKQLADQEDAHIARFREMREALTAEEKQVPTHDPYGELDLYIKAMLDGIRFELNKDPAKAVTGRESLEDIFRMAIQAEKDAVLFYSGLRDAVVGSKSKERIQQIIREEMSHIVWLTNKRAELAKK
jgi:rubrerythrin